jgi:hypothetical protein
MTVDVRTRIDGEVDAVDPAAFFDDLLPAAFARNAERLALGARWLDPVPLTVEVDGRSWTITADDGRLAVAPGGDGARLRISVQQLTDLAVDQQTPMAWLLEGSLDATAPLPLLLDWWVLIRGALDDRTPYTPGSLDFDGIELGRSFPADAPLDELRAHLEATGHLHIEGVFTETEMAEVSADIDRAEPTYSPGDGASWWAKTADGDDRVVRLQGFGDHSPIVHELFRQDQFMRIGDIPGAGHKFPITGDRWLEALIKPIGVVEGISDVPWHKDCANGRHSYECSNLTVGVSVTGADADSGQLRAVAGSNRALIWPSFVRSGLDLPQVDLPTRTGDVTVHLSCTTHMAQPPVTRERRVLYTSFRLPAPDPEAAQVQRDRMRAVREAAPINLSQPPSPVRPSS